MDGGVPLFIRDYLIFFERNDLAYFDEDIESVYFEMGKDQFHSRRDIVSDVMYLPHNKDIVLFNDKLSIVFDSIKKKTSYATHWGITTKYIEVIDFFSLWSYLNDRIVSIVSRGKVDIGGKMEHRVFWRKHAWCESNFTSTWFL